MTNKEYTTMKKAFFLVAVATLALLSCQKENDLNTVKPAENHGLTFKASIEALSDPDTKAAIDASNGLVWAENDMIGIYFPDWGDKNQPFRLNAASAGQTEGEFTIASAADPTGATATAAYFPWWDTESLSADYPSSSQTNVWEGVVYFKMKSEYYGYSNGRMLTPLVAPITSSSDNIAFKHAGAAVKVTINNLVSGTYHTTMSVTGKQISGDFHVNPANAGTEALTLDAAEDATKNSVTLHAWKSSGAFSWIFPVPELTKPKLQFEIKDNNGVPVWSKKLKAQANDLGRGDILVMPALTITPYEKFVQDDACAWSFSGNINGSAWQDNVPMVSDGKYWILAGCTFKAGDKFKIRKSKAWDEAYPSSDWVFTDALAGSKDIIFNSETKEIQVVAHSFPYPEADLSSLSTSSITINGDMTDWTFVNSLTSNSTGTSRIRSWKFASDANNLYFYYVLRKNRMSTAAQFKIVFNWDNSGGYSVDDYSGCEADVVFQPFTNAAEGTPTCVNGTINEATINGTAITDAGIKVFGSDPNVSATGDSADYYIEVSIPKSKIPSLPASGTLQAGATYAWYETGFQDITL